ncbi:MAG: peptidase [Candidatus Saccharibacteria bacterium]|nr:peptidase [Candidatus Saccharibacteria bacterium]MDB5180407.1 peptidase [Candidatus Saccharibacteria bacterium]
MEPNRKHTPDFEPDIRPDLRSIPGGGQSTPRRGNLSAVPNNTSQELSDTEQEGNVNDLPSNVTPIDINRKESEGDKVASGGWVDNSGQGGSTKKITLPKKVTAFFKKRGGILGLIIALAIGGGALSTFFGPASMLINLAQNATLKNDTSSTAIQHRFMKVFGFTTAASDPICAGSSKTIKCKMGRISNKALDKLASKDITPFFDNEEDNTNRKKTGYPSKNPTHYDIDMKNGAGPVRVPAPEFLKYISDDPKLSAKVLGRAGAFYARASTWSGKHITKGLYEKFGLKRDGGLADGSGKKATPVEKLAAINKKLRERMPGSEKISTVPSAVEGKIRGHLGKAGKAGAVYTFAVASCIAVKAPGYIASGVAAVQLAQVMPVGMDGILSPGAKAQASGVDTANSISGEDADAVGTLYTNRTAREGDGRMTSALDSPLLQSATGVSSAKPPVSKDYTPGYSILRNPLILAANQASAASEPACNVLMSPAAMYTAMTISAGVTIALSTTVIGGVVKTVADFFASAAVTEIAVNVAGNAAKTAVIDLAKNDKITKASGQALGDVTGISLMSMFSAGGMARHLPVLKKTQLPAFRAAALENAAQDRNMDIATLSPFDTSSKYTFLGSIVNNAQLAVLQSGTYNGSILSLLPGLMNFSRASLSTNVNAETYEDKYCDYAKDFGLETENPDDTPAINAAGLPCTGLTDTQLAMDTDFALQLMIQEGWVDNSKPIGDTDTLDDLLSKNIIKTDTPLSDYMSSCGDASTGDYIFNAAGCTVSTTGGAAVTDSDLPGLKDPRSLEAMAVFLLDYQQVQMINGSDEGGPSAPAVANTSVDDANLFNDSTSIDCAEGTQDAGTETGYNKGTPIPIKLCLLPNTKKGNAPVAVNSRASGVAFAMFEQMKTDLGLSAVTLNDSFRTMADQQRAFAQYGSRQAAKPGYSNHQMGFALDINMGAANGGNSTSYKVVTNSTYPGNRVYEWLVANAGKYHFSKLGSEGWHWSINGG